VGGVLISMARAYAEQSRMPEAIAAGKEAEVRFTALTREFPDNAKPRRGLSTAWNVLGEFARREHDGPAALEYADKAIAAARTLAALDEDDVVLQRDLAAALQGASITFGWLERYDDRRKVEEEALAINRKLRDAEPENLQNQRDLMMMLEVSMQTLELQGDLAAAEARAKEMDALRAFLAERGAENETVTESAVMGHDALSFMFVHKNDFTRAFRENQLVIDGLSAILKASPESERVSERHVVALIARAELAVRQAEHTHRRADWEFAREATRTATTAYAANVAMQNSKTDGAALGRVTLPEFVARTDAALAGKPLPPLPSETIVR
jgi:tetratricopeptide (TPR) repeat protein